MKNELFNLFLIDFVTFSYIILYTLLKFVFIIKLYATQRNIYHYYQLLPLKHLVDAHTKYRIELN